MSDYSGYSLILQHLISAGIINPIEAKLRKGKGAVGAYGNERTQQSLQDFPVVDSEEEEEKVKKVSSFFELHPQVRLYHYFDVISNV